MSEQDHGGERRRLDRAPGERYAGGPAAAAGGGGPGRAGATPGGLNARARAIVAGVVVADAGALLYFAVGLLDLGAGMIAVAAFIGWVTGVALIWWGRKAISPDRLRLGLAAGLATWAIVLAMAIDWVYALVQGGALGPLDYVVERYGWWGIASIPVAALLAGLRAR
jgi:hypothetical protein